ncbi:hypothetical protein M9458_056645 [Cirrhinus mrigala]|uniref:Peptidase A2 domain-containing protein n=1 Tax=Cirrhinus mrigala TaxID=683832 RepID=A0ABD0MEI2_CIRMR
MRPNVTDKDRFCLMRTTSSPEVRSFLDRQPAHTKTDYHLLRNALIKEFADPESEQGLVAALETKQEHHIKVKALLDTGADITLMSTELFEEVQERTKKPNGVLKLRRCELNLQAYSHMGLQLKHVAPIHLTDLPKTRCDPGSHAHYRGVIPCCVCVIQQLYGLRHQHPQSQPQIQQILREADALHNEADHQGLKEVLYKYKDSFAKDSLDCGLTNIHTVRVPTNPNAPPTFMRQYKIPIVSYEPVQEIIDSMLEKGIIRPCNSTYSAPIWPVLKPNGKWRPTVDYRKLNQQVPLSRWPMTQLDQELPKIKGSMILSTVDVASGFWTIPVHPDD